MRIYQNSVRKKENAEYFICTVGNDKYLGIKGDDRNLSGFTGEDSETSHGTVKLCQLSVENANIMRKAFPFTNPVRNLTKPVSIGLGDRLGLASGAHIKVAAKNGFFPVLAQQSIRELNLTGRTYPEVLACAVFAVFQEGYEEGYGADGDHLKTAKEVTYALESGFTMITLDCSEHIVNDISALEDKYAKMDDKIRKVAEEKYLGKSFRLNTGEEITFGPQALMKAVIMYTGAISHTINIFNELISKHDTGVDFEISVDETHPVTSPQDHYYVASELTAAGVSFTSLAPKFCGEFQKGIDYIGNIEDFKTEFELHAKIADHFGYKISVHSGSDKFSVFPYVGKYTGKRFHLKTAGTNWLEAVRTIAAGDPGLYRRIYEFALKHLDEAKKYYHIGARTENIRNLKDTADSELPRYLDLDDSRQVIHITYGLILSDPGLKKDIYSFLNANEDKYYAALEKHIGRHATALGL